MYILWLENLLILEIKAVPSANIHNIGIGKYTVRFWYTDASFHMSQAANIAKIE